MSPLPTLGNYRLFELERTTENIQHITIIPWMGETEAQRYGVTAHSPTTSQRQGSALSPLSALLP